MKKWFLHILLLAGLFGVLTTSCSQEEGLEPQASDETVQVMFTIALDGPSARSRATWGDNYDNNDTNDYDSAIGDDFDNYIDPDKFFAKLTLGTNTYDVKNIAYWQQPDPNKNIYEFVGEVEVNISQTTSYPNAKVMVYANMDSPTTQTFGTSYTSTNPYGVQYIPMWGVQTVSLSLTPGTRTTFNEPIYLLRAMAKVEINLTAEGYTLEGVTLNRYNPTGYNLPAGAAKVENTKKLHYDNESPLSFNPCTTTTGEDLDFSVSNNHLVFYLPEVANSAGENELVMTFSLKKGTETVTLQAPYLYFRQYTDGKAEGATPFDVVRNHWYRYNITAVNTSVEVDLGILYQVMDWTPINNGTLTFGGESGATHTPAN